MIRKSLFLNTLINSDLSSIVKEVTYSIAINQSASSTQWYTATADDLNCSKILGLITFRTPDWAMIQDAKNVGIIDNIIKICIYTTQVASGNIQLKVLVQQ